MDLSISLSGYNYNLPSNQSQSGSTITTISPGPNHDYHASPANSTTVISDDPGGPSIQYLDLLPRHARPDLHSNYRHSHSNPDKSPHANNHPWKQRLISHDDDHSHNHSHSDSLNLSPDDHNNTGCNPLMKLISRPNPALITTPSIACKNELQLVDNLGPIMDIGLISSPNSAINPRKKSPANDHRPATVITTSISSTTTASCNGTNYAPRLTQNSNATCAGTDQLYTIDVNEAPMSMSAKSSIISCPIDQDSRALTASTQICNSSNISSSDVEVVEASDHIINSHIKQRQYQYNKLYYKDSATSDPMAHQLGPARKRGRYVQEHDHEGIKQQQDDDDDDGGGGGGGGGDGDELDQEEIYNASCNSYGQDPAANYSYNVNHQHSNGDGTTSSASTILRKKLRLSREQSGLLEESFKLHSTLNPKQKGVLARQLGLSPRQVEVWFQNRRARTKLKQTEADCELLKRCCETLTAENRRLRAEVAELRRRQQAQQARGRTSSQACAAGSESEPPPPPPLATT